MVGDCSATEVCPSGLVPCGEVFSVSKLSDAMGDGVSSMVVDVTCASGRVEELGDPSALVVKEVVPELAET